MSGGIKEYLPLATTLRLLAVLTLTMAPHALRVPLWESLLIAATLSWRGLSAYRQWRMPPGWLRAALTVAAFAGIYASYGRVTGQNAGTALLCIMVALKLVELRARRDVMVMVFLMYFLMLTHFLFSQEMWTAAYLLTSIVAITALLIECQHLGALSPRQTLRSSAVLVAQSLPLMLLLFVLFPRIPGPLWGLPSDAGASRSGMTDSMSPGDISKLIQSDEIAFRVEFEGAAPPPQQRYWRGPVFDFFDGRKWENGFPAYQPPEGPPLEVRGTSTAYTITLEGNRMHWLFALEMPARDLVLPFESYVGRDGELLTVKPILERVQYSLRSYPDYRIEPQLGDFSRRRNLRLPEGYNPRAVAYAEELAATGLPPEQLARRVLDWFNRENFVYTLQPPELGRDSVDDFLFGTRRGFCEHYASAFTFLMRAAGVPARVVAGYQGGMQNPVGNYYVVRQSDAHAWTEIWVEGRGWLRVDPTAAIAPSRIEEGGIESALSELDRAYSGSLAARTRLRFFLEARWDWANMQWNTWVLAYDPERQLSFLRRFGIEDFRGMILALTFLGTAVMAVISLLLLRQFAPARIADPALREWRRMTRKLARAGYPQQRDEGAQDYAERVAMAKPEWAETLRRAAALYQRQRYLQEPDLATATALAQAVRALKV